MKKVLLLMVCLFSVVLFACTEDTPKEEIKVEVTGETKVFVGENIKLNVNTNGDINKVEWSSSNKNVATVDKGTVTGVSEGTAVITAQIENASGKITITVEKEKIEYSIQLSKTNLELEVGKSETIVATVTPTTELVWKSYDESIATVENGKITALKAGTVVISATTIDGATQKTVTVKVKEKVVEEGYTVNNLKQDLIALKAEYITAKNVNITINVNKNFVSKMIYNMGDNGTYEEFLYEIEGNTSNAVYVKNHVCYSKVETTKSKSSLSLDEEKFITEKYNASLMLKEVASFYDEDAFYSALEKVSENGYVVTFSLSVSDYLGDSLNVAGVDIVHLVVTLDNNKICAVELLFISYTSSSLYPSKEVKVTYSGTNKQTITFPSDLENYVE